MEGRGCLLRVTEDADTPLPWDLCLRGAVVVVMCMVNNARKKAHSVSVCHQRRLPVL